MDINMMLALFFIGDLVGYITGYIGARGDIKYLYMKESQDMIYPILHENEELREELAHWKHQVEKLSEFDMRCGDWKE